MAGNVTSKFAAVLALGPAQIHLGMSCVACGPGVTRSSEQTAHANVAVEEPATPRQVMPTETLDVRSVPRRAIQPLRW